MEINDLQNTNVFPPEKPDLPTFPTGKREFLFAFALLILGCLLCNSVLYGGFHLGFAVFAGATILCSVLYLLWGGCKLTPYPLILLCCSLVITASFARSDDGFVKFVLLCFLILSVNLALCLLAGQNRRSPNGFLSLLDMPRTVFVLGCAKIAPAFRGLRSGFQKGGDASKKGGAIALGILISVPLLAIVIPLLISADAAFDALLQMLPDWDLEEILSSIFFGAALAIFLYSRGASLRHAPKAEPDTKARNGMNPLTVNTVLFAISFVYLVYLVSQLAYFSGGFLGILPEDYTMAEYARRGFFEMGWLCAVNLGTIALAVALSSAKGASPKLTKWLCLFLSLITLFLVVSASAKMLLYIDAFGLTRLRVLTEVIMLWLGIATAIVCIWLFAPKLPYMKLVLVIALVMGAMVAWANVDTVVTKYNVNAYISGKLETVDVDYLGSLGSGATPYLVQLAESADPQVAASAKIQLDNRTYRRVFDIRDWNYTDYLSDTLLVD